MIGKTTQFVYRARAKVFNYVISSAKTVYTVAAADEIGSFLLLSFTPPHTHTHIYIPTSLFALHLALVTLFIVGSVSNERRF